MDKELMKHNKNLEILSVEEQEEDKHLSIAQKKAVEKELASKYGTLANAKKILGFIKIDRDTMHSLFGSNPELRSLSMPGKIRRA